MRTRFVSTLIIVTGLVVANVARADTPPSPDEPDSPEETPRTENDSSKPYAPPTDAAPIGPPPLAEPIRAPAPFVAARPPHPRIAPGIEGLFGFSATNSARQIDPAGQEWAVGFGIGALFTLRYRLLHVGLIIDAAQHIRAPSNLHLGAVIGPAWDVTPGLRLELLAEGGVSVIASVGQDLFAQSVTGDTSAALPYVGLRASFAWRLGAAHRTLLGFWLAFREDVQRVTLTPLVTNCIFGCTTTPETWSVGGETLFAGVRIGYEE